MAKLTRLKEKISGSLTITQHNISKLNPTISKKKLKTS